MYHLLLVYKVYLRELLLNKDIYFEVTQIILEENIVEIEKFT